VSSSVIKQWEAEIKKHVKEKVLRGVFVYRSSINVTPDMVECADIVITSYYEVMKSYPVPSAKLLKEVPREDHAALHRRYRKPEIQGLLQHIKWYRVVLDEAHAIKKDQGRTSEACISLDAKLKWAITGTPILNSLDELCMSFHNSLCDIPNFLRRPLTIK
jgi:SNF2 family DNA or RNA helicase